MAATDCNIALLCSNTSYDVALTPCTRSGLRFVGPSSTIIDLFGDKTKAKEAAMKAKIPVLPGSAGLTNVQEATAFLQDTARNLRPSHL